MLPRLDTALVREVVLVNNSARGVAFAHPKLRVLDQPENIFVNPAWNLGVSVATGRYVFVSNDDISIEPTFLGTVLSLARPGMGLIGPHPTCYIDGTGQPPVGPPRLVPTYARTWGFGSAMLFERERWVVIPEDLKIIYGDDYVFNRQRHRNYHLYGVPIVTEMSTSSSRGEFSGQAAEDARLYEQQWAGDNPYLRRFRVPAAVAGLRQRWGRST